MKIYFALIAIGVLLVDVQAINLQYRAPISNTMDQESRSLTQSDLSNVKIPLSQLCTSQQVQIAEIFLFDKNATGARYNFDIVPLTKGEFRMAFVGDSITEGYNATSLEQHATFSKEFLLKDNKLGYTNGQVNSYESQLLGLLHDNNKTMKYAMMNYGRGAAKLMDPHGKIGTFYKESCRHEQMTKSLPHVVFIGHGYIDSLTPNFTAEKFVHTLSSYVQEVKNLPSKPIVMLVVPVVDKLLSEKGDLCMSNVNHPYFPAFSSSNCTLEQRLDLQQPYYKVANMTGIPDYHVINAFALLRLNPNVAAKDYFTQDFVHPNKRAMAVIAQDIFMKMSQSPEIQERQKMQKNGIDEDWNNAVRAQLESQQQQ